MDNKVEDMIVAQLNFFLFKQEIKVYQNNEIVERFSVTLDQLVDTIEGAVKKYNINKVHVKSTNPFYNVNLKQKLMTKFAENPIEIIFH